MEPQMSFDELGHQSVQCSPAGCNELEDFFALSISIDLALGCAALSTAVVFCLLSYGTNQFSICR